MIQLKMIDNSIQVNQSLYATQKKTLCIDFRLPELAPWFLVGAVERLLELKGIRHCSLTQRSVLAVL